MFTKNGLKLGFSLSLIVAVQKTNGENPPGFYPDDLSSHNHVYDISGNFIARSFDFVYRSLQSYSLGNYSPIDDHQEPVFSSEKLRIKVSVNNSEKATTPFESGPNVIREITDPAKKSPNHKAHFSSLLNGWNAADKSTSHVYENELQQDKQCGELRVRTKRIIGGRASSFGRRPWQVALFKPWPRETPHCGGALLNDRWIITAAHCVEEKSIKILTVRMGELNARRKKSNNILSHKEYKVDKKMVHPRYTRKRYRYDIALLKLDRTVYFDLNIIPVCLPRQDLNIFGRTATVSGWGTRNEEEINSSPTTLHEVDIDVIPNHVCQKWFSEAGYAKTIISDIYVCAGLSNGGRDTCQGDSGGPLTTSVNGREVLIGITAWGFGCGNKHSPGLYTNVLKFEPWIRKLISQ